MPAEKVAMRKVQEVLRLREACGLSQRQIAVSCQLSRTTVAGYLQRAAVAGLTWSEAAALDERTLEQRVFPTEQRQPPLHGRPIPDWPGVHDELKRKGVTLFLLWQEYKERAPDGDGYSWFCQAYRTWARKLDVVLRQEHRAGEKLFVDYAGQTVPVHAPQSGTVRAAQIFVAVLGASSYTYAEATWTQNSADWTSSHSRAFAFFGGMPELIVPDCVARHTIRLMWPAPLCGRMGKPPTNTRSAACLWAHNRYSDSNQCSNA